MAFKILFKPIALIDVDEAISWYEKELKGLGYRFLNRLTEALEELKVNPNAYQIIYSPVRRMLLKSFPYKILYFIRDPETIIILGVIHTKRSNRYIKKRLKRQ